MKRTAEGKLTLDNKVLRKIEGGSHIDGALPAGWPDVYMKYMWESYSECVSKAYGAVISHRKRVISSPDCHMNLIFVSLVQCVFVVSRNYQ